jgi:hypothetical protein
LPQQRLVSSSARQLAISRNQQFESHAVIHGGIPNVFR